MNKILVSDIINLNSGNYILNFTNQYVTLNIQGNVNIYCYNETLQTLNIDLLNGSALSVYYFNEFIKDKLIVNINQKDNSIINFNASFVNEENIELVINNYINGNYNKSNINIRNISLKKEATIIINENIREKTINNIVLEDLKGIMHGGFIEIEPNIICSSNEVVANHLTTIGGVDTDSLNYLMSKGINKKEAEKLLLKGFIYSNMDELFKKEFGGD